MKKYNAPSCEVLLLQSADLITVSKLDFVEEGAGDNWDW